MARQSQQETRHVEHVSYVYNQCLFVFVHFGESIEPRRAWRIIDVSKRTCGHHWSRGVIVCGERRRSALHIHDHTEVWRARVQPYNDESSGDLYCFVLGDF